MTDTKNLPATKRAYTYCMSTRELMGELDAYLSPLDGTYPLPANATFAVPGEAPGALKALRLSADGSTWEVVDDYRFNGLWNTATQGIVPNRLALGDKLPDGVTNKAPTLYGQMDRKANEWDASANDWRAIPDYRGYSYWTADGAHHTINDAGVTPPPDALDSPPPTPPLTPPVESSPDEQTAEMPRETESPETT